MVKLLSFVTLFTLIITPIFASALWDLETRDVSDPQILVRELDEVEAAVFARELQGLFARRRDFDIARRDTSNSGNLLKRAFNLLVRSEPDSQVHHESNVPVSQLDSAHKRHAPPTKHQLQEPPLVRRSFEVDLADRDFDDEVLERNLDYELYIRDLIDADLWGRFYDDLD